MTKRRGEDEMDLSRNSVQALSDELLWCPACASDAEFEVNILAPASFPHRVKCKNYLCGLQTPPVKTRELASQIWNRRVVRKPPCLIDKPAASGHTPQRHPRSSGSAKGAGKRATGRKGAHKKE